MMSNSISQAYTELVELRYQLYNSLFMTLTLDAVQQTSIWLPLLQEACESGLDHQHNPKDIINRLFDRNLPELNERERIDFLYKVIQYVERQVVLVDALEDSAYNEIHRVRGPASWSQMIEKVRNDDDRRKLEESLKELTLRVVLTAHPTQFYPGTVLAIITDLATAIEGNRTAEIRDLLDQLGRTPFFRKKKPTPYDEAMLLMNYLERVFYSSVGNLLDEIATTYPDYSLASKRSLIQIGFWPGGDRDGNPNVTVDITRRVAAQLKTSILRCYHNDLKLLCRRLSFAGVYEPLVHLRDRVEQELLSPNSNEPEWLDELYEQLGKVEQRISRHHHGLFLNKLRSFRRKVQAFGFHFAILDLRQDSRVLRRTLDAILATHPGLLPDDFNSLDEQAKLELLLTIRGEVDPTKIEDTVLRDTAESMCVIRDIQRTNGEAGAHRYIISNCRGPLDVANLIALFRLCGWQDKELTVDIVPLFETIDDLRDASESMRTLYALDTYQAHLRNRNTEQTVMLGFSDGTKDGGYLMANWGIYRAKEEITSVSREMGVTVHFFDGRGGPPARGGGNSHLFYSALGKSVENRHVQLTLQGQTISSHYGIVAAAKHNLELVLTGALKSRLLDSEKANLNESQRQLIDEMARISYEAYHEFKQHPLFIPYLLERSTLRYYGMTNIASRPSKRGGDEEEFRFEDLRAIPFVGAWSQLKQNVPGFYGLGTALNHMKERGELNRVIELYENSTLFKTFIANSMQSMSKTNFSITRHMEKDEKFGAFWRLIHDEFMLTKEMVLQVSRQAELLEDNPRSRQSIALRENIVLPLLTIQQYALLRIKEESERSDKISDDPMKAEASSKLIALYEKMVVRSLFGNINATRNAV
ncbi:phosphoenolpyruvate carboxylase [bacterium]|nr:phosphoenolpyruvate carboxylase [bacterium]